MVTWHVAHPTCEHSFNSLKKTLSNRGVHSYSITCPKIYNPYGLVEYFKKDPMVRHVVADDGIRTREQKAFLNKLTDKILKEEDEGKTEDYIDMSQKHDTVRGQKYDFTLKIMKKCNSTDIADLMIYCRNTRNDKVKKKHGNTYLEIQGS